MNSTLQIIKKYKLEDYFKILITENKGNNNPYHNFYHTCCVIKNCYFIAKSENIYDKKIRLILIAATFHDFNHSGGKLSDDKNVKIAIDSFKKYTKESEADNFYIENIIKSTQFPYNKNDKLSISQKVIRDADILQRFEENWMQQYIFGLNKELNGKDDLSIDILEKNEKFEDSLEIFTKYAKNICETKGISNKEDINYLKQILA